MSDGVKIIRSQYSSVSRVSSLIKAIFSSFLIYQNLKFHQRIASLVSSARHHIVIVILFFIWLVRWANGCKVIFPANEKAELMFNQL